MTREIKRIWLNSKRKTGTYRKYCVLVDSEDFEELTKYKWSMAWNPITRSFYALRVEILNRKRKTIYMARFILNAQKGIQVDHINHNTLDNRKKNLRLSTTAQNQMNRGAQKNNTSGYKGVSYSKKMKKWVAQIKTNKAIVLGYFETPLLAAMVYDKAALKYHGEFAFTNIKKVQQK